MGAAEPDPWSASVMIRTDRRGERRTFTFRTKPERDSFVEQARQMGVAITSQHRFKFSTPADAIDQVVYLAYGRSSAKDVA
jgi:hypothetical protein